MITQNLSSTARAMLTAAITRDDRAALPPERLPLAARRSVVQSMLKAGLLEEIAAAGGQPVWRTSEAGEPLALRATAAGLAAVAQHSPTSTQSVSNGQCRSSDSQSEPPAADASASPPAAVARVKLRVAAQDLLVAWDTTANGPPWLAMHFDALRAALAKPIRTPAPRAPRADTKRSLVLTMLRRPEGATVAQAAEATGWARHTVHGFFAGLKKQGLQIDVLERVRQVGSGKAGAKGSYTVYRVAEAG